MVERLMLLASGDQVDEQTVCSVVAPAIEISSGARTSGTLADRVQNFERDMILAELKRTNFHMTNAAKVLGLERSHLYKKAEQLGIDIRKQRRDEES
jgi:two-component system nitrogen regulation response regulator NtrX